MGASKLSKPQLELLTHAVAAGKATCVDGYAPRMALLRLGFVTEHEGKYSSWIEPTNAGRAALAVARRSHQVEG